MFRWYRHRVWGLVFGSHRYMVYELVVFAVEFALFGLQCLLLLQDPKATFYYHGLLDVQSDDGLIFFTVSVV